MRAAHSVMIAVLTCVIVPASLENSHAQSNSQPAAANIECSAPTSPYRDLDFLIGEWEFFTPDGKKIADQVYSSRERGCLILEDWTTISGETGTGMNFVDPFTGKWRQVWMSPRFHLDYGGGMTESGTLILEGRMYPNDGSGAAEIRGIYTRQSDGSITKEFLRRSEPDEEWHRFFIGVARRTSDSTPMD